MFDPNHFANQVLDECHSTNDIAKALAERGFPHGTWISSRVQISGRGRLGRKWESEDGNLFLSIIVRVENKSLWNWIPLTTAIAITRYLRTLFPGSNFQVKWPNDLWLAGKKLGGILCEGTTTASQAYIVIGTGLNCLHSPQGLDQETINLTAISPHSLVHADHIRSAIRGAILDEIALLSTHGPEPIKKAFELWTALPVGTEIFWGTSSERGHIEGLGHSAELLVKRDDGKQVSIFAEDIRLHSDGKYPAT